ncbi:MAG: hypothetical protein FWF43_05185 [Propionibacteriaceae bacterium]|nr:hypothetical protein [Propionibacteriaceae bacterium]
MTVAEILDQVRELDAGELLVLRRVLDDMVEASHRRPPEQSRPYRTVAVDMGTPLIDIDRALRLASQLDDERILEQMGNAG